LFKINPVIVNQYLKIIAVTWDITQKKRLKAENPDYLANSQKELIKIINSLNKKIY